MGTNPRDINDFDKTELKDPEYLSLGLQIFAALMGSAGLASQIAQIFKSKKIERSKVKKHLHKADRALNRLSKAYRDLISIYDENDILNQPFAPSKKPIMVDNKLMGELDRLKSETFYGGRELEEELVELAGVLDKNDVDYALDLARRVDETFHEALRSKRFLEFLIQLGFILNVVIEFIYEVAKRYQIFLTADHPKALNDTLQRLRSLQKNS